MKHRVRSADAYERKDGFKLYKKEKESFTVKDVLERSDVTSPNSAADRLRRWEKGYLTTKQLFADKHEKYTKDPVIGRDPWEGLTSKDRSDKLNDMKDPSDFEKKLYH